MTGRVFGGIDLLRSRFAVVIKIRALRAQLESKTYCMYQFVFVLINACKTFLFTLQTSFFFVVFILALRTLICEPIALYMAVSKKRTSLDESKTSYLFQIIS